MDASARAAGCCAGVAWTSGSTCAAVPSWANPHVFDRTTLLFSDRLCGICHRSRRSPSELGECACRRSTLTPAPAEGGAGSKCIVLGWRVVGRRRGPSGDLTPETRIGPDTTRARPAPRSHTRKRGPCSTLRRSLLNVSAHPPSLTPDLSPEGREEARDSLLPPGEGHGMRVGRGE